MPGLAGGGKKGCISCYFRQTGYLGGNYRNITSHGFKDRNPKSFKIGNKGHGPGSTKYIVELFGRKSTGEDHILFGTDMPYDIGNGDVSISQTIDAIDDMSIPDSSKKKIFEGNAQRLLKL